jgi:hypothetical protein
MLLLSTGSENSSLKNYSYPVKRSMTVESKKFAYCDGSRSARAVAEHLWWTPKEIYYRSIELLNFMFNHWFKEYLSIDEWNSLTSDLNLINFKYDDISDDDYQVLTSKLDLIDVSNEREQLQSSLLYEKRDDIESKLLMDYFDKDIFYLVPNSNKVSYADWKYSFVITKDQDKKPLRLRVATRINGVSNLIEYRYHENTISIWNNDEAIFYKEEEIPDEIKPFLRSLYRYVMKAKQRSKPKFITE